MWCPKYWIKRRNYLCWWADFTSANTAQYLETYCKGTFFCAMLSLFMLSGSFLQSYFLARQSPAYSGPWGDLRDSGLCLPLNITSFLPACFSRLLKSVWVATLLSSMSLTLPSLMSSANFLKVPSVSLFVLVMLNNTALGVNTQRMSLKTDHQNQNHSVTSLETMRVWTCKKINLLYVGRDKHCMGIIKQQKFAVF